jgi:hypothetical protein
MNRHKISVQVLSPTRTIWSPRIRAVLHSWIPETHAVAETHAGGRERTTGTSITARHAARLARGQTLSRRNRWADTRPDVPRKQAAQGVRRSPAANDSRARWKSVRAAGGRSEACGPDQFARVKCDPVERPLLARTRWKPSRPCRRLEAGRTRYGGDFVLEHVALRQISLSRSRSAPHAGAMPDSAARSKPQLRDA